jgi:hypothetical protein
MDLIEGFFMYLDLISIFNFWKKYDVVWSCGQLGIILAGKLALRRRIKFICLNEFPEISYSQIWVMNEKKYMSIADELIIPDEVSSNFKIKLLSLRKQNFGYSQIFLCKKIR